MFECVGFGAIVVLVLAAWALTRERRRRLEADAWKDRRLLEEVRGEIAQERLPEARDRVRAAEGPLARVLLTVLRFPYGVHAQALELARRDGLVAERPAFRGTGLLLPLLSGLCATIGVASLALPGPTALPMITVPVLGLAGAFAIFSLWARDTRRIREAEHRLQIDSWELSRRLVALPGPTAPRDAGDVAMEPAERHASRSRA